MVLLLTLERKTISFINCFTLLEKSVGFISSFFFLFEKAIFSDGGFRGLRRTARRQRCGSTATARRTSAASGKTDRTGIIPVASQRA